MRSDEMRVHRPGWLLAALVGTCPSIRTARVPVEDPVRCLAWVDSCADIWVRGKCPRTCEGAVGDRKHVAPSGREVLAQIAQETDQEDRLFADTACFESMGRKREYVRLMLDQDWRALIFTVGIGLAPDDDALRRHANKLGTLLSLYPDSCPRPDWTPWQHWQGECAASGLRPPTGPQDAPRMFAPTLENFLSPHFPPIVLTRVGVLRADARSLLAMPLHEVLVRHVFVVEPADSIMLALAEQVISFGVLVMAY